MIYTILIVPLIILFICFVLSLASYITHIQMNIQENLPYDFVHFRTFLQEFNKYQYSPSLEYNKNYKSIFIRNDGSNILYLHASIVKFNNKCMIFYPISWIKYSLWIKKKTKKERNSNHVKGLWNVNNKGNE